MDDEEEDAASEFFNLKRCSLNCEETLYVTEGKLFARACQCDFMFTGRISIFSNLENSENGALELNVQIFFFLFWLPSLASA